MSYAAWSYFRSPTTLLTIIKQQIMSFIEANVIVDS